MSFKNILVPYDASGYSERAFKKALDIAEKDDSKITVVTVIDGAYATTIGFTLKINQEIIQKQIKTAEKFITKLKLAAKKKGVPFSLKILHGASIVKTLVNFTNSQKFDLVVIGSHGRTGFSKLVLGSVANGIVQHVKCSVMVVK
jgi:nucleotide-binding universal stress UspA family protein